MPGYAPMPVRVAGQHREGRAGDRPGIAFGPRHVAPRFVSCVEPRFEPRFEPRVESRGGCSAGIRGGDRVACHGPRGGVGDKRQDIGGKAALGPQARPQLGGQPGAGRDRGLTRSAAQQDAGRPVGDGPATDLGSVKRGIGGKDGRMRRALPRVARCQPGGTERLQGQQAGGVERRARGAVDLDRAACRFRQGQGDNVILGQVQHGSMPARPIRPAGPDHGAGKIVPGRRGRGDAGHALLDQVKLRLFDPAEESPQRRARPRLDHGAAASRGDPDENPQPGQRVPGHGGQVDPEPDPAGVGRCRHLDAIDAVLRDRPCLYPAGHAGADILFLPFDADTVGQAQHGLLGLQYDVSVAEPSGRGNICLE